MPSSSSSPRPFMHCCIQLSAFLPHTSYGGERIYREQLGMARLADRRGFESVAITEHHRINILMMPAPLRGFLLDVD